MAKALRMNEFIESETFTYFTILFLSMNDLLFPFNESSMDILVYFSSFLVHIVYNINTEMIVNLILKMQTAVSPHSIQKTLTVIFSTSQRFPFDARCARVVQKPSVRSSVDFISFNKTCSSRLAITLTDWLYTFNILYVALSWLSALLTDSSDFFLS